MSVPVWRRTESDVEFLSNFHKLRKETIQILMRDFGIKKRQYSIQLIERIYSIDENDKELLEFIMKKYGISSADVDKYPTWLIDTWRSEVLRILNLIGVEIELGNSIYITNESEYIERRHHFTLAIGYCNALKDKFQEILFCLTDVKVGAYEQVGQMLAKEIKLLKGLRKADNKLWNKLKASVD